MAHTRIRRPSQGYSLLVTYEHSNAVPRAFLELFAAPLARAALASHRGYDLEAKPVARALARR